MAGAVYLDRDELLAHACCQYLLDLISDYILQRTSQFSGNHPTKKEDPKHQNLDGSFKQSPLFSIHGLMTTY